MMFHAWSWVGIESGRVFYLHSVFFLTLGHLQYPRVVQGMSRSVFFSSFLVVVRTSAAGVLVVAMRSYVTYGAGRYWRSQRFTGGTLITQAFSDSVKNAAATPPPPLPAAATHQRQQQRER